MLPYIWIFGKPIPMYGLFIAIGIVLACFLCVLRIRRKGFLIEDFAIISACVTFFALIFSKVLYLFVSVPFKDLAENIKQGNIAFLINNGQVFYGGLIGGCLGAFIGAKIAKVKLTDFVDLVTPGIPLGHAFGRIGCFFAGCCYGRPFERPIGIEYHKPIGDAPVGVPLFPVQLLEAAINLIICMVLVLYTRKHNTKWKVFSLYLIMYSVGRYFLEYLRYDAIRGKLIGISTSQWISISLFVVGLILWRSRFAQESKATDSKAV